MRRFFLPPDQCGGSILLLTGREAHHALHVVRVRHGDPVVVLDGAGMELHCEVKELKRDSVSLAVIHRNTIPPLPWQTTLAQAVPKGKVFDSIVQKATEIGAARVVPLLTERVVTRLSEGQGDNRVEHWRQTAIEANKQCGSAWLPQIDAPKTPAEFLARKDQFELALIASLQSGARHAREWFAEFQLRHGRRPRSVCVWIGPEGDFTPDEVAAIESAGALPITLGRLVLRSDTAAIYCLSVVSYELQSK